MNNSYLKLFMHICKKYNFKKYKNWIKFGKKWKAILNFLKTFKNLKYKDNFNINYFLFHLSILLRASNTFTQLKIKRFNPRTVIYLCIYVWLGKSFFFNYFKDATIIYKHIYKLITGFNNISINYFFISNQGISAKFLANYICLKLKKFHYIFKILNPVKRELWRLTKESRKPIEKYKIKYKKMYRKTSFKFRKIFYLLASYYIYTNYIYFKSCNTHIVLNINEYKLSIKNKKKINFSILIDILHYIYI